MPLIRLSFTSPHRDSLSLSLFDAGALGLQEEGDALVTVIDSASDGALRDALEAAARAVDGDVRIDAVELPDIDWTQAWRERIGAHDLGGLTVVPPWLAEGRDPATTIVIDPAMAFGTGEHQTTRCVVRLMQGMIRPGDTLADLGAGSAVLSIAAVKLGASRAIAIEMDPDAIPNAELNCRQNGVADRVTVIEGNAGVILPLVAPVRVVLANIISSVLIELMPQIAAAVPSGGEAIWSGILLTERETMLGAIEAEGEWIVTGEESEGEWWAVKLLRK